MIPRSFTLLACFGVVSLLHAAPSVPLVNLVDDQTLFAISVTDAPALLRGWDAGPVSATWSDPVFSKFLAPLREQLHVDEWDADAKAATGLTVRELFAMAGGEVLIAVPAFNVATFDAKAPPPFLVAVEVGGQAARIEKIMAESTAKESIQEETETFAGVQVHLRPIASAGEKDDPDAEAAPAPKMAWAIVDGIWLIGPAKERVFAAIDAVKQGGVDAALGKSDRFLRTRQRVGAAQSLVYVNFPAIYPVVRDAIAAAKAKSAQKPNLMGLDAGSVFNAFGLDKLGEGYAALLVDDKRSRLDFGLVYNEDCGLLKLIAYQPGPAPRPDWVPAKWPSVSTARFSPPKAYSGLEELVEAISPMLSGMAQGQIRSFNKKLGVDLVRDFIGSLGDDLVSAYAVPPSYDAGSVPPWTEMDQLVAISLTNEPAFIKSVDALKRLAGPAAGQMFIQRDYLGHTLYTLNAPTAPGAKRARGFSYAIANGTLLLGVGSPTTVEGALQGMASRDGSFWERADVKAALADLPADASALQVQDLRVMVAALIETAVQLQEAARPAEPDAAKHPMLDVSARPDADAIGRHWGLSSGYVTRTSEGLFSTTYLSYPKP